MPQFVSQMTKEEMEIESKKATLDGMKDLMKSFKELEELDSDSESDTDTDYDSNYNSTSNLESRIHYMKLDIRNLSIDLSECKEKLDEVNQSISIFKKVDNQLIYLNNLEFYLKDINSISLEKVKRKLVLFKEEETEHTQLCLSTISKIDMMAIRNSLSIQLTYIKEKNRKIENELIYYINKKRLIEIIKLFTLVMIISLSFIPILVYLS